MKALNIELEQKTLKPEFEKETWKSRQYKLRKTQNIKEKGTNLRIDKKKLNVMEKSEGNNFE